MATHAATIHTSGYAKSQGSPPKRPVGRDVQAQGGPGGQTCSTTSAITTMATPTDLVRVSAGWGGGGKCGGRGTGGGRRW